MLVNESDSSGDGLHNHSIEQWYYGRLYVVSSVLSLCLLFIPYESVGCREIREMAVDKAENRKYDHSSHPTHCMFSTKS